RCTPHPIGVMRQPVRLERFWDQAWNACVIWCKRSTNPPQAHQRRTAERLKGRWHELDTGHYPMLTEPAALARLIVEGRGRHDMPIDTKYLFIVSMDVAKEKEALFNEVYDTEHVPLLMKVPGVKAVTRLKTEPAAFNLAGERKILDGGSEPTYVAIYELESPDVLLSKEWGEAAEKGRWPSQVRPYTTNRRHVVRKVIA